MWKKYERNDRFSIDGLYSVYLRDAKRGFLFSGEVHDFWEMMYCAKGGAVVSSGERISELNCNQLMFFKPMEFHSFRVESAEGAEFFIASFDIKGELGEVLSDKVFNTSSEHKRMIAEIVNYIKFNVFESEKKRDNNFLDELAEVPYSANVVINMLENFIICLLGVSAAPSALVKTSEAEIYSNALRIIDKHLNGKISVQELSKKCNVSPTYLKSIFKKFNGLGIHEYILKIKINLVKQMLSDGKTLSEISEELGFTTQNYLSTVFKRETGMTASEYKRQ